MQQGRGLCNYLFRHYRRIVSICSHDVAKCARKTLGTDRLQHCSSRPFVELRLAGFKGNTLSNEIERTCDSSCNSLHQLAHPWVIDTSVIYQHTRGPPYKASLKWLAGKWLNKEIQKPGKAGGVETIGHNSEEDAKAAIELVKLKMEKGPTFGEFATDQESIFERLERAELPRTTCIVDHGNPGQWHGAKASVAIACTTDEEVGAFKKLAPYHFNICEATDR